MKEEPSTGQKTLSLNGEPECIRFIESQGFDIKHFYLDYMERWRAKGWKPGTGIYSFVSDHSFGEFTLRDQFIIKYGFAILDRRAIEAMRPCAPLLELGAGSGYWTYELRKYGVDCIAIDDLSGRFGFFEEGAPEIERRWHHHYTNIEVIDAVGAVRKYPGRNLLIVWPSYKESWAADALDAFTGSTVIYMGEGYGNATADDRFHELLDERFADQEVIPMPHFEHSYDRQLLICKQPLALPGPNNKKKEKQ